MKQLQNQLQKSFHYKQCKVLLLMWMLSKRRHAIITVFIHFWLSFFTENKVGQMQKAYVWR